MTIAVDSDLVVKNQNKHYIHIPGNKWRRSEYFTQKRTSTTKILAKINQSKVNVGRLYRFVDKREDNFYFYKTQGYPST